MTAVPEPSDALVEAIADEVRHAVRGSTIGWPRESVDLFVEPIARAAYAAMVEHLGLTEETRTRQIDYLDEATAIYWSPTERRLVSRWEQP